MGFLDLSIWKKMLVHYTESDENTAGIFSRLFRNVWWFALPLMSFLFFTILPPAPLVEIAFQNMRLCSVMDQMQNYALLFF